MTLREYLTAERLNDEGRTVRGSQTERALVLLTILIGAGLIGILVAGFGYGLSAFVRFVGIGLLAALVALGFGAVLGLLFSLPTSARQVIIVTAAQDPGSAPSTATPTLADAQSAAAGSGYIDNNSLQQIGTWLTGAIVALSLSQFDSIAERFDTLADEVSVAMISGCAAPGPVPLLTYEGFGGRLTAPAAYAARHAQCVTEAPGGLILAGFAILGFLLSYLWGRRYLAREFSASQHDGDDAEAKRLDARAVATNLTPTTSSPAKSPAAARTTALPFVPAVPGFPAPPQPGSDPDDPWKGAFGGLPTSSVAGLAATVVAAPGEIERFLIDLRIAAATAVQRDVLKNTRVRLFLHQTYRNPVRMVRFDGNGEVRVALSAYGAFTVGAQLEDGTLLELDLANLSNAPPLFKSR